MERQMVLNLIHWNLVLGKMLIVLTQLVLLVIPQAISTRYGFAVGANFMGLVCVLMIVYYLIAYHVGKVISKV
ncbi:unnamed protein product [Lactuca virosa]|uniref:Amino acid transporter transmembrane domain-containing protein n=1 Tax=Lactuca virosa TaxID=75947 RepID=A0AAU9N998_9ASTR|nr:unnamed protein product [Lactuca virosa]